MSSDEFAVLRLDVRPCSPFCAIGVEHHITPLRELERGPAGGIVSRPRRQQGPVWIAAAREVGPRLHHLDH